MKDADHSDPIDRAVQKVEIERNMRLTQHVCFTILHILREHKTSLSVEAIAQQAKMPPTCPIPAFVDGLVLSGYLTRTKVSGVFLYSVSEKNRGPFLPLPYYVLDLYPPDYDTSG
jgi:hypothetical protein